MNDPNGLFSTPPIDTTPREREVPLKVYLARKAAEAGDRDLAARLVRAERVERRVLLGRVVLTIALLVGFASTIALVVLLLLGAHR